MDANHVNSFILAAELAGQKVGITPPTVLTGKNMQVAVKTPVLCIPDEENGDMAFEINYSLH